MQALTWCSPLTIYSLHLVCSTIPIILIVYLFWWGMHKCIQKLCKKLVMGENHRQHLTSGHMNHRLQKYQQHLHAPWGLLLESDNLLPPSKPPPATAATKNLFASRRSKLLTKLSPSFHSIRPTMLSSLCPATKMQQSTMREKNGGSIHLHQWKKKGKWKAECCRCHPLCIPTAEKSISSSMKHFWKKGEILL